MRLELLYPPQELNPNDTKTYRKKKWGIAKKYRGECKLLAQQAGKPEHFKLLVTFHPPCGRRRDKDNMIAAFKSGQDGLSDAWGVNDSQFDFQYVVGAPVKRGAVIITDGDVT